MENLKQAVSGFRAALIEDFEKLQRKTTSDEFRREMVRIISVKRGNVSSSELPSLKNFIELTEREIAIRALDRMESGFHL